LSRAAKGGIQVDDVQDDGTLLHELSRLRRRVLRPDARRLPIALVQPHCATFEQVDRRVEQGRHGGA